ncbi:response regulator transcription factor [Smaragdicoccus niigatensis]|uniref:response regulator transcription factor n=1 Tax=Smaragdicoccus niigatensis TaxID=359359 RepID=UPI000375B966
MVSLLIVEEDIGVRKALRQALEGGGFDIEEALDPETALRAVSGGSGPDLLLIDLPHGSGSSYLRRIRRECTVPIIVTSDGDNTDEVVDVFEAGADDFVAKPFEVKEVAARVRALRRRAYPLEPQARLLLDRSGPLILAPRAGKLVRGERDVHLTVTEFRLLCELAEAQGQVLSRHVLLNRVWDRGYFGDDRIVDVHVRRLRVKIEQDPSDPHIVVTVRGLGYRLDVA